MIGALFTAGVGALAFKLGMDTKQMIDEGYSTAEILTSIPCNAKDTVVCAFNSCRDTVLGWFSCGEDSETEDSEAVEKKAKPKKSKSSGKSKKKQAAKKATSAKKQNEPDAADTK